MRTAHLITTLLLTVAGLVMIFIDISYTPMLWGYPVGCAAEFAYEELKND